MKRKRVRIPLFILGAVLAFLIGNSIVQGALSEGAEAERGGFVYEVEGPDLQVREFGTIGDPPIVLLHCYTCSSHYWDRLAPLLARDHRVIAIDLTGHGRSAKPRSGDDYEMPALALQVQRVLQKMRVRRALVAGHSLGGVVAVALAEQAPEMVNGVVVMDSAPSSDLVDLPFTANLGYWPLIGPTAIAFAPDSVIRESVEKAFTDNYEVPDSYIEDVKRMTYSSYDSTHSKVEDYLDDEPLDSRLDKSGKQALVIFGEADEIVKPKAVERYRDVLGADVHTIPKVGHNPQLEAPLQVWRLMERFERILRSAPDSATG